MRFGPAEVILKPAQIIECEFRNEARLDLFVVGQMADKGEVDDIEPEICFDQVFELSGVLLDLLHIHS